MSACIMSLKRPPNEFESRLHQAALSAPKKVRYKKTFKSHLDYALPKELTAKQAEALLPDPIQRQSALNFLLGVGLFKGLVVQGGDGKGKGKGEVVFRAIGKEEIDLFVVHFHFFLWVFLIVVGSRACRARRI